MQRVKTVLEVCLKAGSQCGEENGAYKIYLGLNNKLEAYENLDLFMKDHENICNLKDDILAYIAKAQDRQERMHLIGFYLQDRLGGRFVKEEKRPENRSLEEHAQLWFTANKNLNPETDAPLVYAGFLSMFYKGV